jgi:uncharacterized membrane protein
VEQNQRRDTSRNANVERIARGLGWFSIGLGAAEILAPGPLAGLIGLRDQARTRTLLRFYGVREIGAGIGILMQREPAAWLWGRVAGDAVDLVSLGAAMSSDRTDRTRLGIATAAVAGVTALDVYCGQEMTQSWNNGRVRITKTVIIDRPADQVYGFWRNFENLPTFMRHVASVTPAGDGKLHWTVSGPGGKSFEWDAHIMQDRPNAMIAWRSEPGADVENSGAVWFDRATGDRGTLVRVDLEYAPPGGALGSVIAKIFGKEPGQQLDDDLRAFKSMLETGEVVKSEASIHRGLHPARPAEPGEIPESDTMYGRDTGTRTPRLVPA